MSCKGEEMPAQADKFNLYVLTVRELDECFANVRTKYASLSVIDEKIKKSIDMHIEVQLLYFDRWLVACILKMFKQKICLTVFGG